MLRPLILALTLLPAAASNRPPPADPLTGTIHTEDADRFAALFAKTKGKPTAAQLKRDYLDKGSVGIGVFTPGRIVDADTLARAIAVNPTRYAQAIKTCLPAAKTATADLRAIYLGLHGALPDVKLPQVYIVFGANTSGGTPSPARRCSVSKCCAACRRRLRNSARRSAISSRTRRCIPSSRTPA